MRKYISIIMAAVMMVVVLAACSGESAGGESNAGSTKPDISKPSEDGGLQETDGSNSLFSKINTVTLDDEEISGADFAGERMTVLNIWASWCPPCITELPHLQEISENYADKGVKVVGVMHDGLFTTFEKDENAIKAGKALLADAGAEYTVILPDQTITSEFVSQMRFFPTTFFLDADGNIIKTIIGAKDSDGWRKEIDGVLS